MIFSPMSVVDLKKLHQKIQKPIFVRFPKNNKQTFLFNNIQYCNKYKGIILYNEYKTVETNVEELLVQMTHQTYQLRQLQNDADYKLALAVYESYMQDTPREAIDFMYLLAATISDYEAEHYPIAISSTVAFIDHLLEERSRSWANIRACLGYGDYVTLDFVKSLFEPENMKVEHIIKLSHFFKLPIQAFIVSGYNAQP